MQCRSHFLPNDRLNGVILRYKSLRLGKDFSVAAMVADLNGRFSLVAFFAYYSDYLLQTARKSIPHRYAEKKNQAFEGEKSLKENIQF